MPAGTIDFASSLPSMSTVLVQIFACMWVDDTLFYWGHRVLHHPKLYAKIHKQHHKFFVPSALAVEYAHPVEDLFNTVCTVSAPLLFHYHLFVFWLCLIVKIWQSIDAHSGFNLPFPLSPWSCLPSMDSAPAHDLHHSQNTGNYGGYFVFWDWLMGTKIHQDRKVVRQ
eukprot:c9439_g1_i1.p1 GENE.c9439_g1_i1~~c9439_g1_i1.p1  ORF type:complete len:168 (+),score=23.14 c9439_g1_i1:446-949(+)